MALIKIDIGCLIYTKKSTTLTTLTKFEVVFGKTLIKSVILNIFSSKNIEHSIFFLKAEKVFFLSKIEKFTVCFCSYS